MALVIRSSFSLLMYPPPPPPLRLYSCFHSLFSPLDILATPLQVSINPHSLPLPYVGFLYMTISNGPYHIAGFTLLSPPLSCFHIGKPPSPSFLIQIYFSTKNHTVSSWVISPHPPTTLPFVSDKHRPFCVLIQSQWHQWCPVFLWWALHFFICHVSFSPTLFVFYFFLS